MLYNVMVSVFILSVRDRGFVPRSCQTKPIKLIFAALNSLLSKRYSGVKLSLYQSDLS